MSYHNHTDGYDAPSPEDTGIFPVMEPLPEAEPDAEAVADLPRGVAPDRWLMAGGTVVAMIAAFVAFSAGSPPVHAMPSPFSPAPASTSPTQPATPATCIPMH